MYQSGAETALVAPRAIESIVLWSLLASWWCCGKEHEESCQASYVSVWEWHGRIFFKSA